MMLFALRLSIRFSLLDPLDLHAMALNLFVTEEMKKATVANVLNFNFKPWVIGK